MAGTITHFYFAEDVMRKVKKVRHVSYDDLLLRTFAQSMDPFHFYSIFFPILPHSGKVRFWTSIYHHFHTDEFFSVLLSYIRAHHLENNDSVMAFVYGVITHYVLDSSIHPFVEYRAGLFQFGDKTTYKYNAKHHEMETFLDIYLLQKHGEVPSKFRSYKEVFCLRKIDKELKEALDYSFDKVYGFPHFSKYYLRALRDMRRAFRVFRYDPWGYKEFFYKGFDKISPKMVLNAKFLSYRFTPKEEERRRYLNFEHDEWHYPVRFSLVFHDSFEDIYQKALKRCQEVILAVYDYLYRGQELDFRSFFSLSHSTGIVWDEEEEHRRFEF